MHADNLLLCSIAYCCAMKTSLPRTFRVNTHANIAVMMQSQKQFSSSDATYVHLKHAKMSLTATMPMLSL